MLTATIYRVGRHSVRPVGYLTNAEGKKTHAIIPLDTIDATVDEWDALPSAPADEIDQAFLTRFEANPDAYLAPAPVKNPIRSARIRAQVTQADLATALGISPAALSKQEQEGHAPRPRSVDRALKALAELNK